MKNLHKIYNTNLLLLLFANFISCIGIGITQMYSLIYIYEKTHSNFYASLQACAIFGSGIIASYLYTLRSHQKNLVMLLLITELCSSSAAMLMASFNSIYMMYAMLVIIYALYGFSKPSFQTMLYRLSNESRHIKTINSTSSVLYTIALALGWLVSPLLFHKIYYTKLFMLNGATYFISGLIVFILLLKLKAVKRLHQEPTSEIPNKINHTQIKKPYFSLTHILILVAVVAIMFASINGLEMGIFRTVYHLTDNQIGLFFAVWILAGCAAGLSQKMPVIGTYSVTYLSTVAVLLLISATLFSYSTSITIGAMLYALCGFLYIYTDITSNHFIYIQTDSKLHPENFSKKNLVTNAIMLTTLPIIGYLADIISISLTMLITVSVSSIVLIIYKLTINLQYKHQDESFVNHDSISRT